MVCENLHADPEISGLDPMKIFIPPKVKQSIPLHKILRGGPRIDGIPALVNPYFVSANAASFLHERDMILGIQLNGEARAYPIKILNWHEIVNHTVGSVPVAVTYCPLCRSGIAFDRRVKDKTLTFGVSGLLYNSAMVFYDWETRSLWSQILGDAVVGELTGASLKQVPIHYAEWREWKKAHPETLVLSNQTGHFRDYEQDPYTGYERSETLYFPVDGNDRRLKKKELVYGISMDQFQKAYPLAAIQTKKKIEDKIGNHAIVIEWKEGSPAAHFLNGNKISGLVVYWFAWSSFYPKTELYAIKSVEKN